MPGYPELQEKTMLLEIPVLPPRPPRHKRLRNQKEIEGLYSNDYWASELRIFLKLNLNLNLNSKSFRREGRPVTFGFP